MRWGLFWLCGLCATLVTIIAWKSGERRWLALAIAVVAGAYLGVLASARPPEGQALARRGSLLERLQGVPDWAVLLSVVAERPPCSQGFSFRVALASQSSSPPRQPLVGL